MKEGQAKIRTREELIAYIQKGKKVKYLFFWGHTPPVDGSVNKSCFSQWFPAKFELDGKLYLTAEHFMMAEKARLFSDEKIELEILECVDPSHAKKLGRKIKNYDDEKWKECRFDTVVKGNAAKFTQNAELKKFLLATQNRVLVEASPPDCIWGIGLAEDDPKATDPNKWRGLNLLGFALMEARDQFIQH